MSNFFSLFGGDKDKRNQNDAFSLEKLHKLYRKLLVQKQEVAQATEEIAREHSSRELVVETIRQLTEALLWGEKNDAAFFDFFCEKNILSEFVEVLALDCPRIVKIQLLQTLSMLVQNIKTKTSLYYIFSNNHLNMLIGRSLDWKDEEILAYYITLLKSLAIRLNPDTVNFFFKPHEEEFPLYSEAIRFFNHRDQMIRAAIRTLTLQIYRIDDADMRSWVVKRGGYYFTHLACYMRDLWLRLNSAVLSPNRSVSRIKEAMDQVEDLHIYLNDVFAVGIEDLNEALGERILVYAIYPFLIGALVRGVPSTQSSDAAAYQNSSDIADNSVLGRSVGIYLLQRVLTTFTVQTVIDPLVETLISKHLSTSMSSFCYGKIAPTPVSYPDISSCYSQDCEITRHVNDRLTIHLPNAKEGVTLNNPFRAKLLKLILVHQTNDADLFLATSVIHSLVTKKISRKSLEESGLISTARSSQQSTSSQKEGLISSFITSFGPSSTSTSTSSSDDGKDPRAECLREVILPMCQAFQYPHKLRSLTFLALHRTITEILLAQPRIPPHWMPMIVEVVGIAARKSATELKETLKGDFGKSLVEVFLEHWEAQKAAIVDINVIMGGTDILALSGVPDTSETNTDPLDWVDPNDKLEPRIAASRRLRCFLVLRRIHRSMLLLANKNARESGLESILDSLPFDMSADVSGNNQDGLVEGHTMELTKQDRILCSVQSKTASTRYLVKHTSMVVLVEPDAASAGWGIIRTLCPVRCVEPYIDRGDPRTLNLFITQTGVPPGGATSYTKGQSRPSYSLALSFEDTRRCHLAQCQINESRKAMQMDMLHKLTKFVEQHC